MKNLRLICLAALSPILLLAWVSASAGPPPGWFIDESKLPFDALPGATAYWGVHTGAGYRIEVPDNWNGDLVVWAHGYRGTGLELIVDNHPLRQLLVQYGYAWAASSYRSNDYDVANGVKDTHALTKRFNGIVGKPDRVFLSGASMGGHITAVAVEQYPKTYDGALAICGSLADFEQLDYLMDFNVAAQQIGVGYSTFPIEPFSYLFGTVPEIKANLEGASGSWPFFLNAAGENLKGLTEMRTGGDRPNFDNAWDFWNFPAALGGPGDFLFELGTLGNMIARSPGIAVDNSDVVYQFDTDPALSPDEVAFNSSVFRQVADPQARNSNGLAQLPVTTGDLRVPMITVHNLGDLFVPVLNEIEYARRVAAKGNSDLLVQRAVRGVLHCDISPLEFSSAFVDLINWVENDAKPAGDNWLDPAAVAAPEFGCTFNDHGSHFFEEPCP